MIWTAEHVKMSSQPERWEFSVRKVGKGRGEKGFKKRKLQQTKLQQPTEEQPKAFIEHSEDVESILKRKTQDTEYTIANTYSRFTISKTFKLSHNVKDIKTQTLCVNSCAMRYDYMNLHWSQAWI